MADSNSTVKVAAVHAATPFLNLAGGVEQACGFIHTAGQAGAQLVAFPESYLPGYPSWVWSHTPKHAAPLFEELYNNSVQLPGPASDAIAAAAREVGLWVIIGVDEKDGGTLYNTLAYYSPNGNLVARHRKLQPTNAERTVWGRGDGRDVFVVDAGFARVGGLICSEHTMDLSCYALATLGEQIHVAAWPPNDVTHAYPDAAGFDHYSLTLSSAYAIRNQCFVIVCQGRITPEIVERLGIEGPEAPSVGGGVTGFMGPDGRWIGEPNRDDEAVVYADFDLDAIAFAKYFTDGVGHYARPDVFSFGINRAGQQPLSNQRVVRSASTFAPIVEPAGGDGYRYPETILTAATR